MYLNELDEKFRKIMNIMYALSVVKNAGEVKKKEKQKQQAIKDEPIIKSPGFSIKSSG